jgi:hypothetical protein
MTVDEPQVAQLQQMLQAAFQHAQMLEKQLNDRTQDNQTKVEVAKIQAQSRIQGAEIAHPHGIDPLMDHSLKAHEIGLKHEAKMIELDAETKKFILETMAQMQMHRDKMAHEKDKMQFAAKQQKKVGDGRK